jgi:hypothetical protein
VSDLDVLEYARFVKIEPIALKVKSGGKEDYSGVVEEVIMMYGECFFAALVKANDAKLGTFLKVGVFSFGVVRVDGVVVKLPSGLYVCPKGCNSAGGPRLASACVRPQIFAPKVGVLEM